MTYTQIFAFIFFCGVLPLLIVGIISRFMPTTRKTNFKPSREALITEIQALNEENRWLKKENAILLSENRRLRRK